MKNMLCLQGPKAKLFVECQGSIQKDVERAFGMLEARFVVVCGSSQFMKKEDVSIIMKARVTLHSMIVEDK